MRETRTGIASIGKRGDRWVIGLLIATPDGQSRWVDWPWSYPTRREARAALHRIPKHWTGKPPGR
jgi:hypothetical protein